MPLLEEALRLDPTPTVWFDLALAYRGAGRIAAAVTAFERYLTTPEADAPEARLRAIRDELPTLLRSVARLRLAITPADAVVRVDGREALRAGDEIRVDPGTHVLDVEAPNHQATRREITPQAGMTMMLEMHLQPLAVSVPTAPPPTPVTPPRVPTPAAAPARATVTVEPNVPTASISIDGVSHGSGLVTVPLEPGEHQVVASAAGHTPWRRTVMVTPGSSQRLSAVLTSRQRAGWVLPVAVAGGAMVATAVVVGILIATRGEADPTQGNWATVREP